MMWEEGGGPIFIEILTAEDGAQSRAVLINLAEIAAIVRPSDRVHDHGGVHMTSGVFYRFATADGFILLTRRIEGLPR